MKVVVNCGKCFYSARFKSFFIAFAGLALKFHLWQIPKQLLNIIQTPHLGRPPLHPLHGGGDPRGPALRQRPPLLGHPHRAEGHLAGPRGEEALHTGRDERIHQHREGHEGPGALYRAGKV